MGSQSSSQSKKDISNTNIINIKKHLSDSKKKNFDSFDNNEYGGGYKSQSDPNFSWHHDTLKGKKVLSSLTDAFYMD